MSRCRLQGKDLDQTIYLGIDPPFQTWFFQLHSEKEEEKGNGNEGYVHDIDNISKNNLLTMLEKYANLETVYAQEVFKHVGLDLDPGNIP